MTSRQVRPQPAYLREVLRRQLLQLDEAQRRMAQERAELLRELAEVDLRLAESRRRLAEAPETREPPAWPRQYPQTHPRTSTRELESLLHQLKGRHVRA